MTNSPTIGGQLRLLRRSAGLTQAELATRLGCTQRRITNIEGGSRRPSVELLGEWARACGRHYVYDFSEAPMGDADLMFRAACSSPTLRRIVAEILSLEVPSEASLRALEGHIRAWRHQVEAKEAE